MIIEFENGDLTVNTSCGTKIGLVWNGLFHNEKPAWYREKPQEFDWEENLEWKAPEFSNAFKGKTLIEVDLIGNESTITGIVLSLSDGQKVGVVDYGDITKVIFEEELSEYLREEKRNGCILSNITGEDIDANKQ